MLDLQDIFGHGGPLARALPDFRVRREQLHMAQRVADALAMRESLVVEAGTGTGKTFAYLVPALLSGRRVLISTGTRTLQDQLYNRDIPLLAGALGRPVTMALLKGRGNYLCLARLAANASQSSLFQGEDSSILAGVREWAATTRSGDLAEAASLGESHPLRAQLASTRETCTGARCPEFAGCHVFAARRAALEAELVVVNHHLLLADLALKEDGYGELLPGVDAFIIDEAHQLPDLAAEFFGVACSSRQVETLLFDSRRDLLAVATPADEIARLQAIVEQPLRALGAALGHAERRMDFDEMGDDARTGCEALRAALGEWARALEAREDAPGVAQCASRGRSLAADLDRLLAASDDSSNAGARTVGVTARGFVLNLLPYDVSTRYRALVDQHPSAWIYTSATLAVGEHFGHFSSRLGLDDAATLCLDSPFDYER